MKAWVGGLLNYCIGLQFQTRLSSIQYFVAIVPKWWTHNHNSPRDCCRFLANRMTRRTLSQTNASKGFKAQHQSKGTSMTIDVSHQLFGVIKKSVLQGVVRSYRATWCSYCAFSVARLVFRRNLHMPEYPHQAEDSREATNSKVLSIASVEWLPGGRQLIAYI